MGCVSFSICKYNQSQHQNTRVNTVQILANKRHFVQENECYLEEIYRIKDTLGSGIFGEVFLCIHRETSCRRVVKVIQKDTIKSEKWRYALMNEIDMLRNLTHPNIIPIYEFFEDSKSYSIIVDYCSGGSIADRVRKRGPIPEQEACDLMRQLLSGLSYLHDNGYSHKDLRCDCILFEDRHSLNVRIAGFGAVTSFESSNSEFLQTKIPDVNLNEKSDMWFCGMIMYKMLSNSFPFENQINTPSQDPMDQTMIKFQQEIWLQISAQARDLIRKLLQSQSKRPTAKQAMQHEWFNNFTMEIPSAQVIQEIFGNLKNYYKSNQLRDIVATYIVTNCISPQLIKDARNVFRMMDKDGDGRLTSTELIGQYAQLVGEEEAKQHIAQVMFEVDSDQSGEIDYTEYLKAALGADKIFSKDNLKVTFNTFDKDRSGSITLAELKAVLDPEEQILEEVWNELFSEIDNNGDGEIDYNEFEGIILSKI